MIPYIWKCIVLNLLIVNFFQLMFVKNKKNQYFPYTGVIAYVIIYIK